MDMEKLRMVCAEMVDKKQNHKVIGDVTINISSVDPMGIF